MIVLHNLYQECLLLLVLKQRFAVLMSKKLISIPSQAACYFTISFLLKSKRTTGETV